MVTYRPGSESTRFIFHRVLSVLFVAGQVIKRFSSSGGSQVKVSASEDAGLYLCEYTYYRSLHSGQAPAVFIHIPPVGEPYSLEVSNARNLSPAAKRGHAHGTPPWLLSLKVAGPVLSELPRRSKTAVYFPVWRYGKPHHREGASENESMALLLHIQGAVPATYIRSCSVLLPPG